MVVIRPCPACGQSRAALAFRAADLRSGIEGLYDYARCEGCGSLFLDPLPSELALRAAYEAGAVDPLGAATPDEPTELPLARKLLRATSRALTGRPHSWPDEDGRGRRLLDVGCLAGDKLVEFHRRGWEVAGLDLHREALERARARFPGRLFHPGPVETLPASEKFDLIRADNVVEHLSDPLAALSALRGHLREGGRVLLYVPSGESLSIRLVAGRSASAWVPYHLQLFSRRGLCALLERAGFRDVAVRGFTPLDWWKLTARQIAPRHPRAATLAAGLFAPAEVLLGKTRFAEEWVAEAR